jgi:hypothetical protein
MKSDEESYFRECIRKSRRFLEFGAGFSTKLALDDPERIVYSIETSVDYISALRKEIESLYEKERLENLHLIHIDIGPTKEWGRPISDEFMDSWPTYSSKPWEIMKAHHFKPDLILIDGRFRVSTFLQAWKNAPGATIIFDDFFNRPQYHKVVALIKPLRRDGRIATFKIPGVFRLRKFYLWKRLLPIFRLDFE